MNKQTWKQICNIAGISENELIIIESLDLKDIEERNMRNQAEEKIIDTYIENVVRKIGYIPENCSDKNLLFEACLGCGLCQGTNPIQQKRIRLVRTRKVVITDDLEYVITSQIRDKNIKIEQRAGKYPESETENYWMIGININNLSEQELQELSIIDRDFW